ncbi:hypothetical protein BC940DRAFT_311785 [Gongronella butleri]|nr:hypothetical protein BC940DRAFT_311785 [Gongronella butleri]
MFAQFADLIAPSKKAGGKQEDNASKPAEDTPATKASDAKDDSKDASGSKAPPPQPPLGSKPPMAPKATGWSNRQQFRPIIRQKPASQARAKPSFVIPAGATVVSTTTAVKPAVSSADASVPAVSPAMASISSQQAKETMLPVPMPSYMKEEAPKPKKKAKSNQKAATASNVQNQEPAPIDLYEDYDPLKPTDYEQYKEEITILQNARKRRYSDSSSSTSSEMSRSPSPSRPPAAMAPSSLSSMPSSSSGSSVSTTVTAPPMAASALPAMRQDVDLQETGDDAYLRRVKLQQQRNAMDAQHAMIPSASQNSTAWKMMNKYGWQAGQGLGKSQEGIREALQVQSRGDGSGVILPQKRVSTVLLLTNMVLPQDVDDQLQQETAEECAKYGHVERCIVHEVPPHIDVPMEESVRIFVKFDKAAALNRAIQALNGRFFGGRVVSAVAYDQDKFDAFDLDPS